MAGSATGLGGEKKSCSSLFPLCICSHSPAAPSLSSISLFTRDIDDDDDGDGDDDDDIYLYKRAVRCKRQTVLRPGEKAKKKTCNKKNSQNS